VRSRLRQLHADQGGFTLTELLTAMVIGTIVLMAAFVLLDRSTSLSNEVADRQDAVQRGRLAMEMMTRQLRSQVCLGDTTEPITYGDANRVSFYADLSDGSRNVEQRTLSYDATSQRIVEDTYAGVGTYPTLTFPTLTRTNVLLTNARRVPNGSGSIPIFRYYAFRTGGVPGDMEELPVPLDPINDAPRVVMVKLAFVALPARTVPRDIDATTFYSDVYVRLADPSRPTEGPRCL